MSFTLNYHKGDVVTLHSNGKMFAGRVGWNGLQMNLTIPLGKTIGSDVSSASINWGSASLYACGSNFATNIKSSISNTSVYMVENLLVVILTFSTKPLTLTDGALTFQADGTVTITFN